MEGIFVGIPGTPKQLLIVDDDSNLQFVLEVLLTSAGYQVEQAKDGIDGLTKAVASRPDLVVLDGMMPRMNGWELASRMSADPDLSSVPILFMSDERSEPGTQKGLSQRSVAFLPKPFSPENLLSKVSTLLGATGESSR